MEEEYYGVPGTVSKILWHFTGGPKWNPNAQRQYEKPKLIFEAYDALLGILNSRELRLGSYRELVKIQEPILEYKSATKRIETVGYSLVPRESSPVCCLADIPIAHLSYHAARYGKVAVGFHRDSAIAAGFNPVLYSLQDSPALNALHLGFGQLEELDQSAVTSLAQDALETGLKGLNCSQGHPVEVSNHIAKIAKDLAIIGLIVKDGNDCFRDFLAFVKTFDIHEFSTIYCEREWRSTKQFSFAIDDIAMIVLPRTGDAQLFSRFISEGADDVGLPRGVPVVPWEDLIEH